MSNTLLTGAPGQAAACPNGTAPFFRLNAVYTIQPGTTADQLLNDVSCLMNAGLATLDAMTDEPESSRTDMQWAALYLLQQADAVLHEARRQLAAATVQAPAQTHIREVTR